jgi:putative peptide zinc metalloprotease protein
MTDSAKKLIEARKFFLGIKLKWENKDYFLFFYGIMSHLGIVLFLYFVVFVNPDSILFFPNRIIALFINLRSGNFNISFVTFFELLIPLTFFILLAKSVKSFFKLLFR